MSFIVYMLKMNRGDSMNKIIKLAIVLAGLLLINVSASAQVADNHEEQINWSLTYPTVIVENNPTAQEKINTDISQYIDELRQDFQMGYYKCGGRYKLHYEDSSVISLSLYLYRLPYAGNGNHWSNIDLVYDKATGNRIPLYHYVHATAKDLDLYKRSHSYAQDGTKLKRLKEDVINRVPDDYFLIGDGIVCIVFHSYEIAAGAYGPCYIKLEPDYINYLNRLNK